MSETQDISSAAAYFDKVKERLTGYFDTESVPECLSSYVSHWTHFKLTDEKYFMSQKMNLYTVHAHRYVGLAIVPEVTAESVRSVFEDLRNHARAVGPTKDTMSTDYTIALISQTPVDPEVSAALRTLKHNEAFALGLRGWADVCLVVADVPNKCVLATPGARTQLSTVLWSFDDKPAAAPKAPWYKRICSLRCGCFG